LKLGVLRHTFTDKQRYDVVVVDDIGIYKYYALQSEKKVGKETQ
jgi:hypothetical protein